MPAAQENEAGRKPKTRKLPPTDPAYQAIARLFFDITDPGFKAVRVTNIMFGSPAQGLDEGLIDYEVRRQGVEKRLLDYTALGQDVEQFYVDFKTENPTLQLRDCKLWLERWVGWRSKQASSALTAATWYDCEGGQFHDGLGCWLRHWRGAWEFLEGGRWMPLRKDMIPA